MCKNDVVKNDRCFRIPKASSGYAPKNIFCVACTTKIVEQSKKDIAEIENEISAI